MRVLDLRKYRRPHLAAIGWGINLVTVLNMFLMLVSGKLSELPMPVRFAPVLGIGLALLFNVLGMSGQPKSSVPSR